MSPYKRIGRTVYSKSTGRWRKKQTCKSAASAERAIKLLRAREYNPTWKPTGKPKK